MQESKKEILLCLAGKSPQIVTEALYSLLASKAIRIDKIVVITTNECREQKPHGKRKRISVVAFE